MGGRSNDGTGSDPEIVDGSEVRAERDVMMRRLATLPRRQRAAVVLRYYVGLSDLDIAAHLGCKTPTVRSQISRALASLRLAESALEPTSQETR